MELYARTHGIPRLINAVCDNLLVTTFAMEQKVATLPMLDEVCRDLRLEWLGSNRERRGRSRFGMTEEQLSETSYSMPGD